jgi:alpha-L-fucosidase
VRFSKPVRFDRALSMEWLNEGQHVESYAVEVWQNGVWKSVASGQAIGHKKIDSFPAVTADRVRLRILSAAGEIRIREFQLFDSTQKR